MTRRNLIRGGASALALGFALIAAPALAQISYPSTPAERDETAELNRNGVMVYPAAPEDEAAYQDAQSDYQARLDAYNAQQRAAQNAFNARQNDYQAERQSYDAQRNQYDEDVTAYDETVVVEPFDSEAVDPADVARLERLEDFADDGARIADTPVEDRQGNVVGRFRRVQEDRDGYLTAVITLRNRRSIEVPTIDLRYDPVRDTVLTDLTYNELQRMRRS